MNIYGERSKVSRLLAGWVGVWDRGVRGEGARGRMGWDGIGGDVVKGDFLLVLGGMEVGFRDC